jgi:hypothetical protein
MNSPHQEKHEILEVVELAGSCAIAQTKMAWLGGAPSAFPDADRPKPA